MSYWITNTNGLLNQYLQINSSNFKSNLELTQRTLGFLEEIFDINQKFTKYVFIDEIVVFFVRTHHTNFVRLYNKFKKYH